jgi:hypothetical protein
MIPRAVLLRRWSSSNVEAVSVSASVVRGYGRAWQSSGSGSTSVSARVARCFCRWSLVGSTTSHLSHTAAFSSIATLPVDEVTIVHHDDDGNKLAPTSRQQLQIALAAIVKPYHQNQQPVVVRGVVKKSPATKLWSSWDYWHKTTTTASSAGGNETETNNGDPMVSVEIGGSYGTNGSERAEIPFSAYLQFLQLFEERHGRNGSLPGDDENWGDPANTNANTIPTEELVYMAQNDLLAPLYKDVMIPDFCRNGTSEETADDADANANANATIGLGRLYSVMMWLGPRGCVSPLHYDPLDNCFLQHVGRKRVLLFAPNNTSGSVSGWHYAGHEGQQSNTSPIDPEVLDHTMNSNNNSSSSSNGRMLKHYRDEYPLFFEDAPPRLECILEPGDFLYIPSRWWHHVRSIDTSASVNVWWR